MSRPPLRMRMMQPQIARIQRIQLAFLTGAADKLRAAEPLFQTLPTTACVPASMLYAIRRCADCRAGAGNSGAVAGQAGPRHRCDAESALRPRSHHPSHGWQISTAQMQPVSQRVVFGTSASIGNKEGYLLIQEKRGGTAVECCTIDAPQCWARRGPRCSASTPNQATASTCWAASCWCGDADGCDGC